ncbi:MAG: OmpA family protein [Tagaea sp.]|nr:OmpA family protein [Magnetospirillum sp.]
MIRVLAALFVLALAACAGPQSAPPAREPIAAVTVFFDTGSAELSLVASAALERAAERLTADPALRGRIEGYADPRGSAADNIVLSNRRAQAVRDFLTARGVASGRLSVVAMGAESGGAMPAEALERRVVLRLE